MGAPTRSQLTDPICICPSKLDIQQRAPENSPNVAQEHGKHMDCEAFALHIWVRLSNMSHTQAKTPWRTTMIKHKYTAIL